MNIQIVLSVHDIIPESLRKGCKPQGDWTNCLGNEFRKYNHELPLWKALCKYAEKSGGEFYIDLTKNGIDSFLYEIDDDDLQCLKEAGKGTIRFVVPLEKWLQKHAYYEGRFGEKLKVVYPDWRRLPSARIWDALDKRHRECIKKLVQRETGCENAFPVLTQGDRPLVQVIGTRLEWFAERFPEYVREHHIPPSPWELVQEGKYTELFRRVGTMSKTCLKQEYNNHQFGFWFTVALITVVLSWLMTLPQLEWVFFTGLLSVISITSLWKSSAAIHYRSEKRSVPIFLGWGVWLFLILLNMLYLGHFWLFSRQTTLSMASPRLTLTVFHPYWISEGDTFDVELYLTTRDTVQIEGVGIEVRGQTANLGMADTCNLHLKHGKGACIVRGRMYVSNPPIYPTRAAFSINVEPHHKDYDYEPMTEIVEMRVYPWAFGLGLIRPFQWLDNWGNWFQFPKYHLRDNSREFLLLFVQIFIEILFTKITFIIFRGWFVDERPRS